jgi:hypothetical protein
MLMPPYLSQRNTFIRYIKLWVEIIILGDESLEYKNWKNLTSFHTPRTVALFL